MQYAFLFVIAAMLAMAQPGYAAEKRPNLMNLDKSIELNAGESKRMYVSFNHSSHTQVACRICHHTGLKGNRYASCTSPQCHAQTAPSSREPLSVYMAYHAQNTNRSCFGCHKPLAGKYPGFKGCSPCHLGESARKMSEASK